MVGAGAEMTIEGCTDRALSVYADAIATHASRAIVVRLIVVLLVLPLAITAAFCQQVLLAIKT